MIKLELRYRIAGIHADNEWEWCRWTDKNKNKMFEVIYEIRDELARRYNKPKHCVKINVYTCQEDL